MKSLLQEVLLTLIEAAILQGRHDQSYKTQLVQDSKSLDFEALCFVAAVLKVAKAEVSAGMVQLLLRRSCRADGLS